MKSEEMVQIKIEENGNLNAAIDSLEHQLKVIKAAAKSKHYRNIKEACQGLSQNIIAVSSCAGKLEMIELLKEA